jgi:hypothetical protein
MPRVGFEPTIPASASEDSANLRPLGYRDRRPDICLEILRKTTKILVRTDDVMACKTKAVY